MLCSLERRIFSLGSSTPASAVPWPASPLARNRAGCGHICSFLLLKNFRGPTHIRRFDFTRRLRCAGAGSGCRHWDDAFRASTRRPPDQFGSAWASRPDAGKPELTPLNGSSLSARIEASEQRRPFASIALNGLSPDCCRHRPTSVAKRPLSDRRVSKLERPVVRSCGRVPGPRVSRRLGRLDLFECVR